MPMATCASAMGGAGAAMATAAVASAKRECVCVCKICYDKMAAYTVRITGWVLKRKSQLYRALNHYLRSLQSLKHTYHLRIRLGGVSVGRESCEKIGETLLFSLPNFFESETRRTANFLATNASLWSILYLNCWMWSRRPDERRRRRLMGCWAACLSLGSPVWKYPKHTSK